MKFPSLFLLPLTASLLAAGPGCAASVGARDVAVEAAGPPAGLVRALIPPKRPSQPRAPGDLLREGQELQDIGEYEEAIASYREVQLRHARSPEAPAAAFNLGVASYLSGDYQGALKTFSEFRAAYPGHEKAGLALFWLAQSYQKTGDPVRALDLYASFMQQQPLAEGHVRLLRVALLGAAGDTSGVLRELDAINAGAPASVTQQANRLYAEALMNGGDYGRAADVYALVATVSTGSLRLETLSKQADALSRAGRREELLKVLAQLVQSFPASRQAFDALPTVSGQPGLNLTPYQVGRVYYFHWVNDRALEQFSLQRRSLPDSAETSWARYRTAIVYERLERNEDALRELAAVAADYPGTEAAQDALWERASLLAEMGRFDESNAAYEEFNRRFPGTPRTQDAAFKEGLNLYKSGRFQEAAQAFSATAPGDGEKDARNRFWGAKALLAAGDRSGARQAFTALAQSHRGSYYGFRAEALASGVPGPLGTQPRPIGTPEITQQEVSDGIAWLAGVVPGVDVAAVAGARARLDADPSLLRARLLSDMGLFEEARNEYRAAVRGSASDPAMLFSLAGSLHARGQHAAAILAATYLAGLAPGRPLVELPRMLLKVLYPAPFSEQVELWSQEYAVDPLLLYALMKQESLFNPWATSSAEAKGLTQVIPSTGADIAGRLGVVEFNSDLLYRPNLSIRFGAYYLSRQLGYLGQPSFALAAYNGGAGNALRWMGNDRNMDPDLFAENIDFQETSHYVQIVVENYGFYRMLYGR